MSKYFPKAKPLRENVKIELDLYNNATKTDLKYAAGVDTLNKVNLVSIKSEIDKLVIGKLKTTPGNLSKLSSVVKNEVLKKTVLDELVKKVNVIQAIQKLMLFNLVKKSDHNTKIAATERKRNLILIMVNILRHKNLITCWQKMLLQE